MKLQSHHYGCARLRVWGILTGDVIFHWSLDHRPWGSICKYKLQRNNRYEVSNNAFVNSLKTDVNLSGCFTVWTWTFRLLYFWDRDIWAKDLCASGILGQGRFSQIYYKSVVWAKNILANIFFPIIFFVIQFFWKKSLAQLSLADTSLL